MKQIQQNIWQNKTKLDTDYWVGQPPNLVGPFENLETAQAVIDDSTRVVEAEAVVKPVD